MIKPLMKELAYRTHRNLGMFPRYPYLYTPEQLAFLVDSVNATRDVPGAIVEVGCAYGATTVYLNRHMSVVGIEKPYICIDTFTGFTQRDIDHEVLRRGKGAYQTVINKAFQTNKRKWFERTLAINRITRVHVYQADVMDFDFTRVAPIALCLIDVDLYLPVKATLEATYPLLAPGGMIIVDDCRPETVWDGAHQAYTEFEAAHDLTAFLYYNKLGIIHSEAV